LSCWTGDQIVSLKQNFKNGTATHHKGADVHDKITRWRYQ